MLFVYGVFVIVAVLHVYFDTWDVDNGFLVVDFIKFSFLWTRSPERKGAHLFKAATSGEGRSSKRLAGLCYRKKTAQRSGSQREWCSQRARGC